MKLYSVSAIVAGVIAVAGTVTAQTQSSQTMSGTELANRVDEMRQGNALIRSRLEIQSADGNKRVLQLQIKERRAKNNTDVLYQVLWPNELKDQTVILHQGPGGAQGSIIVPQQPVRAIKSSQMGEGLFGSDLAYQDAVENFLSWKKQAIVGNQAVNSINCQILESQPDDASTSIYAKVRSWIDTQRFIPLRIEKYSPSGEVLRRIDITRVARDEKHHPIPAGLSVRGTRKKSVSQFEGVKIDQDVQFTDADFAPANAAKPPPG